MVRVIAAILAAAMITATWSTSAEATDVAVQPSDVVSISIDSSWGGLGKGAQYHTTITHDGKRFIRDDGTSVRPADISAFLASLTREHPATVVPSDVELTPDALKAQLHEAESCLAQSRSVAAVREAFERRYFDEQAVQDFLDSEFRSLISDDYPKISVVVATRSATITVTSSSSHLFMLPFSIDGAGLADRVFDPAVPHALAALLPPNTVNRERMEAGSLADAWAQNICFFSKAVRDEQNKLGRGPVDALAARYDMQVTNFGHNTGLDRWVADVADRTEPRIHAQIQSNDARGASDFALTRTRMDLVRSIGWLQKALVISPKGYITILAGAGVYTYDPPRFRAMGHTHAAALLDAHANDDAILWIGESGENKNFSTWYLLPDRTMIMEQFYQGIAPFPFAPGGYEQLPLVAPVAPPRYRAFILGTPIVTGLTIHPDGTIETKDP